jgi:hypothetical protein
MKYVFSLVMGLVLFTIAAQAQDTLQQYTGKYKFPSGGPVAEVEVVMQEGVLVMNSTAGASPMRHEKNDEFTLTAINGIAVFTRSPERKISGVHIEAMGYVMDGTKEGDPAIAKPWGNMRTSVNKNQTRGCLYHHFHILQKKKKLPAAPKEK